MNDRSEPSGSSDPGPSIEKVQDLLKAKDDTSRFVGLALLKTILDNQVVQPGRNETQTLFEAISPKFFDRLLAAQSGQKTDKEEAKNMVDLAVSVLHTFSMILPEEAHKEERLTGRIEALVKALVDRCVLDSTGLEDLADLI